MRAHVTLWVVPLLLLVACDEPAPFAPDWRLDASFDTGPVVPSERDGSAGGPLDGSADGGAPGVDAGPPPDPPGVLSTDVVHLLGSLRDDQDTPALLDDLDGLNDPIAGFYGDIGALGGAVIRPDGRLVYLYRSGDTGTVHLFTPDRFSGPIGSETYPVDPRANDSVIPTPACTTVGSVRMEPVTGDVLYKCSPCVGAGACEWHRASGGRYLLPTEATGFWAGHAHHVLVLVGGALAVTTDSGGALAPVAATETWPGTLEEGTAIRARPDGFRLSSWTRKVLVHIGLDGVATELGTYRSPEGTYGARSCTVLDANDRMYCIGRRYADDAEVVLRYSIDADVEVLHDEAMDPITRIQDANPRLVHTP